MCNTGTVLVCNRLEERLPIGVSPYCLVYTTERSWRLGRETRVPWADLMRRFVVVNSSTYYLRCLSTQSVLKFT